MPTIQAKIEAYTGSISGVTSDATTWMQDGTRFVIDLLIKKDPKSRRNMSFRYSYANGGVMPNIDDFIYVDYMRANMSADNSIRVADLASEEMVNRGPNTSPLSSSNVYPVFFNEDGEYRISPNTNNQVNVVGWKYPTVSISSPNVSEFPNKYLNTAILYTSVRVLQQKMNAKTVVDTEVTAVPPDVPSITAASVTITGTAPTYTKSTDFSTVATYIDTNEDVELASAKLGEIQGEIQDELNEFNKESVEYQATLQKDMADAQFEDAEESKKLQKYSTELQHYQAEVNREIQIIQANMQNRLSEYQWLTSQLSIVDKMYQEEIAIIGGE